MKKSSWKSWLFLFIISVALVLFGTACATGNKEQVRSAPLIGTESPQGQEAAEQTNGEHRDQVQEEGETEHAHGEEGEHAHGQEEEESGERLTLTDTYDDVRNGIRLVIAYHNASSSFVGSIENVTDKTIKAVRVEVHLSSGAELGPTDRMDLAPGEKAGIKLEAEGHVFEWWTPHTESGSSRHDPLVD